MPWNGEQLELFVGFRAWGSSEDEEGLRLVFGEQGLTVEFDLTQFGVQKRFVVFEARDDFMSLPELNEFGARITQRADKFAGS